MNLTQSVADSTHWFTNLGLFQPNPFAAPANYLLLTLVILVLVPGRPHSVERFLANTKSLLLLLFLTQIALGLEKNRALMVFWGKQDDCTCITIPLIPLPYLSHLLLTAVSVAL